MTKKEKILIVVGIGILTIVIIGLGVWFWHRSQEKSIEYENAKQFEAFSLPQQENSETVQPEIVSETEMTEEKQAELVADEKAKAIETPEESEDIVPKPSGSSTSSQAGRGFSIKSKLVGFGHESTSGRDINTIVLHSSHGVNDDPYDVDDVIALWKSYGVAPHYMIARDGTVYSLVADKNIAYHAGDSKMPDGRSGVNNFSIGVEILNTKTDEYTSAQYQAVKDLVSYLKNKYGKMEVVGHDTIAPGRKSDPWNFNWSKI